MSEFNIEEYITSLPDDIIQIDISYLKLTYIPDLTRFAKLETLWCSSNLLTELTKLPPNLKHLYCDGNKLTSLPELPINLDELDCCNNCLIILPKLPKMLTILDCCLNKLSLLPDLPSTLTELDCSDNLLTFLPNLPNNLYYLNCSFNKLTKIYKLSNELRVLYCEGNLLTLLPNLPETLTEFNCSDNNLILLPEKIPKNLYDMNISKNPICEILLKKTDLNLHGFNSKPNSFINLITMNLCILHKFRKLYYSLKFKDQFRNWLWVKVRQPRLERLYHPNNLKDLLINAETDLDTVLNNW
jgi:E3 ubiquitin-protein ligase SspH2